MKKTFLISVAILISMIVAGCSTQVQAQSKAGTTVAPFLTLGTGAKGTALGHAYTAEASGADALFWNIGAAAIPVEGQLGSVMFSNYEMFAGIDYNAIGVTIPVTKNGGVLGLSGGMVNYSEEPVRTEFEPDGTGEFFTAQDLVIGVSYAQPLTKNFFVGTKVKYISQRIWDMQASTAAVDIGLVLVTEYFNGMRLAASIQNFGGRMRLSGVNVRTTVDPAPDINGNNDRVFVNTELDSWNLPLAFKFGVSIPLIDQKYYVLKVMAESHQTNDQNLNGDFGSQFTFRTNSTNFNVRVGYKDLFLGNQVDSHLTYGAGFDMFVSDTRIGFDFAVVQQTYLGMTRMIDLRVHF